MSNPVQVQILDAVEERLRLIDQANGYFHTQRRVERARLKPWDGSDMPALNYWMETDDKVDQGHQYTKRELSMRVEVRDRTQDRPFTDVAAEHLADVWVALTRDPSAPEVSDNPSRALGDLVTYVDFRGFVPAIGEGQSPYCGALIEFAVGYSLKPGDPFTLIN